MRFSFPFVLALLLYPTMASAQMVVKPEIRLSVNDASSRPPVSATLLLSKPLTSQFKLSSWFQVEEGWAEAYTGLSYSPIPALEISVLAGMEQAHRPWRVGAWAWFGHSGFSTFTVLETGGSGPWFQSVNLYQLTGHVKTGVMVRQGEVGPRVDVQLHKKVQVWLTDLLYDPANQQFDPLAIRAGCSFPW